MKVFLANISTALKQISLIIVVICIIMLFNRSNPGFVDISPSPYLIAALIFGALFGLRGALLSSPIFAGVYLYFMILGIDRAAVEAVFTFHSTLLPATMIVFASLLGAITDRLRIQTKTLDETVRKSEALVSEIEDINRLLIREKTQIEARVGTQIQTVARILHYAEELETTDINEICDLLVSFTDEELSEEDCYVYLFENGNLYRKSYRDPSDKTLPKIIAKNDFSKFPLIERTIYSKKMARAEEFAEPEQPASHHHGLVAPLIGTSDQLLGILLVRKIGFFNYIPSTFTVFNGIAQWGSMALSRVHRIETLKETTYRDELTSLFNHKYFSNRIQSDFQLAHKHKLNLLVVRFDLPGLRTLPATTRFPIIALFADILEKTRRQVDTVTLSDTVGSFYTIMMLPSDLEVQRYKERVQAQAELLKRDFVKIATLNLKVYKTKLRPAHKTVKEFLDSETKW